MGVLEISTPPPPSQFQPRLGRDLSKFDPGALLQHLELLGAIFLPPVFGTGEETTSQAPPPTAADSGYSSEADASPSAFVDEYEVLRNDEFEHGFARDWCGILIKRGEGWIEELDEEDTTREGRERVVEKAASLLAQWSGTSAAGAIVRTIKLPDELSLTVNDAAYNAHTPDSVGNQTWGSSILFARRLVLNPTSFSLSATRPLRILELGAGTGVLSLTLASLPPSSLHPSSLVVATDYLAEVLNNLRKNVALNFSSTSPDKIVVESLDWLAYVREGQGVPTSTMGRDGKRERSDLEEAPKSHWPFDARFDVLFGADIVYEAHHPPWIHAAVSALLAFPSELCPSPAFHLFVPLRPTHSAEIKSIEATFPLGGSLAPRSSETDSWRLAILEEESLVKTEGVGRADETEYRRYRIGWT